MSLYDDLMNVLRAADMIAMQTPTGSNELELAIESFASVVGAVGPNVPSKQLRDGVFNVIVTQRFADPGALTLVEDLAQVLEAHGDVNSPR